MGIEHFNHLLLVLQRYHQVSTNIEGNKIAGLNVQWDFPRKQVRIIMRSYVKDLLLSLNWPMPKKPQLLPFTTTPIAYSQKTQFTPDTLAPLLKSLGIPTPRNPHYQALAIPLVWLTPLSFPVIEYLASQVYNRDIPLATTIQE